MTYKSNKRSDSASHGAIKGNISSRKRLNSQSSSMERINQVIRTSSKFIPNDLHVETPEFVKFTSKCDMRLNENYISLIEEDQKHEMAIQESISKLILLIMMCEIFIFHSLIILQVEDEKCEDLYRNEFYLLIKRENSLPVDFCTDLLIKHKLQSEACKFLFIKSEFDRLMEYIQDFFETSQDSKWFQVYVKYIKKIRAHYHRDMKFVHDFVLKHIEWLFDK